MKTGAMLAETDLEKLFAVSRTVIRPVLEHMAIEGCLVIPPHKSARVIEPTPDEAEAIFDVLGVVMRHIIGELADPAREITAGQRRMIELHLEAQGQADKAGDPIAAHLLGVEFLVLLAAIHGRVLFTDLIARTIVLETLSLKLYGEFPPPVFYVEFQSSLARAILAGKPQEALAEFDARLARIRGTLKFDTPAQYEEGDLTVLLGTKR
jgi:DNA-binding GntR family transcriptional regulator